MQYVFLALMCVFAGIFLVKRADSSLLGRLFFKSAASVMFVLVAVSSRTGAYEAYYTLILIGLCLSLSGDVLLVFSNLEDKYFLAGLVAFLTAHIFYIIGFCLMTTFSLYDLVFFAGLLAAGIMALQNKKLKFGKLKIPVCIYTVVLCAMAAKALSMLFLNDVNYLYAILAAIGALFFAFSDLALAFEKFYGVSKKNLGNINIVLYYSGQALIALSVML